jgi:16S rRNA (uracil1498-N3)-methyltransferase
MGGARGLSWRLCRKPDKLLKEDMTRRRFYIPPAAFAPDELSATLGSEETKHLRDVLRLGSGDEVYVFNGAGREFQCAVEVIARDSTKLRVISEVAPARAESPLNLTVAIALLKGEKFDLVIQKLTELGVKSIVPLETERADVRPKVSHDSQKRVTRWRRIALEAAKQTGRAFLPEILAPVRLSILLEESAGNIPRLMFAERSGASLAEATAGFVEPPAEIVALVAAGGNSSPSAGAPCARKQPPSWSLPFCSTALEILFECGV